ncbi:MAG: ABC transporter ATP-binding protein [Panacagrimonas sp.]
MSAMGGGGGGGGGVGGAMAAMGNPAANVMTEGRSSALNWRVLRRIYAYTHPHAAKRNWIFALTALRAVQRPMMGFALGWVVNTAITPGDWHLTLWGALGFALLALFTEITFYVRQRATLELGESVVHDLRTHFFTNLQAMNLAYFHRTKLGSILSRMISDIENVRRGVQHVFFFTPMLFGMMAVSSALMLWQNAALFTTLMLIAPVIAWINRRFHGRMSEASRAVQRSHSRITGKVAESVNGMRVIQSCVQEEPNFDRYDTLVGSHAGNNVRLGRDQAVYLSLLDFNSQAFLALLLAIGGYGALQGWGAIQADDVVTFFFLSNHFFHPLQQIGRLYTISVMAMAGAERICSVLDETPDWTDPPNAPPLPLARGQIEVRNLSFGYLPQQRVLRDIDLSIQAGQTVALVGATGSGKSTLASLIAKFYLPQAGRIEVDGHDLAAHQTASWRQQISIVPQRNFLFTGTVLDNIRLGKLDATEADVRAAAAALDALAILDDLPQGLHTPVGENGHQLSLGIRQLICFVRAWLANPRLLILDEATSAIDTLTEARLQRALNTLLSGRTSIIIAHRLSTIRRADLICVLDHGRIVERGTHRQLLDLQGRYAALHTQFVAASASPSAARTA